MDTNNKEKDAWDKIDIAAKVLGTILVPTAIAIIALTWNIERTERQTASDMTQIAVSILTGAPSPETTPLRLWAISVLQAPKNPPLLSTDAADALKNQQLPTLTSDSLKLSSLFESAKTPPYSDLSH